MTTKKPAIVQCSTGEMAAQPTVLQIARQHKLHAIQLHYGDTHDAAVRKPYADLSLNIGDLHSGQFRAALENLSQHYDIIGILPPPGSSHTTLCMARQVAEVADTWQLPGFSTTALATCSNRYLTRCVLQKAGIAVAEFKLIQFPSALQLTAERIGFPAKLSPIHHGLPHLEVHVETVRGLTDAHAHITRILQNWILTQDHERDMTAIDPCSGQHIRFSISGDMLYEATLSGPRAQVTALQSQGKTCIIAVSPVVTRRRGPNKLTSQQLLQAEGLAGEACAALQIQDGIVTCIVQFSKNEIYMADVLPNEVDMRLAPQIQKTMNVSLDEIWLRLHSRCFA